MSSFHQCLTPQNRIMVFIRAILAYNHQRNRTKRYRAVVKCKLRIEQPSNILSLLAYGDL